MLYSANPFGSSHLSCLPLDPHEGAVALGGDDPDSLRSQYLILVFGVLTFLIAPLVHAAPITYVYDDLGRLVGVVDPAGDTAVYAYDAVGNLLSIARYPSTAVSIVDFTPHSGPAGTTVTIAGTGFSTTPSQNSVSFNDATATVTSSTATQIVVTVPAAGTTGPIAVTAPAGSATSSQPFTVTGPTGPPVITGFTPTVGTAVVTVATITGTNFHPSSQNDKVLFNIFPGPVTSATPTAVGARAPSGGTSGPITVITPLGRAVSAGDFFIPPAPYTAADVAVTGRMAIGDSRTVTIIAAGKIALLVFDGTVGQRLSFGMTAVTIAATDMTVFKPDGTTLATLTGLGTGGGVIDAPPLPVTGTYTVLVDPQTTNTGSLTLTLSQELTSTIAVDGAAVTLTLDKPGQNARVTFPGTGGQRLGLGTTAVTITQSDVSVLNPDGSTLFAPTLVDTQGNGFDLGVLPSTGTYTIIVNPRSTNTGSVTFTLSHELTGTLTVTGSALSINLRAGQNARLTFSGTAGQHVDVGFTSVTNPGSDVSVLKPDGSTLVAPSFIGTSGDTITPAALPVAGTYTVFVDPRRDNAGGMTVTLSQDQTGTIVFGGASVTVTITRPGQNARLTFNGSSSKKASLLMAAGAVPSDVSILKPDGTTLAGPTFAGASGGFLDQVILPVNGTYTVLVDPRSINTGSITLTLYDVADVTGTIVIGGAAVTKTIARPGQNAVLTFNGSTGNKVSLLIASGAVPSDVSLLKQDGTTLAGPIFADSTGGFIDQVTLPANSSSYKVFIDPRSTNTGSMTLTLYNVADVTGTVTVGGAALTVNITKPGQNARVTFSGTLNQHVTVHMTNNNIGTSTVSLLKPDGSTLTSTMSSGSFNLAAQTLPVAGTYTILIDPGGTRTGTISVSVTSP